MTPQNLPHGNRCAVLRSSVLQHFAVRTTISLSPRCGVAMARDASLAAKCRSGRSLPEKLQRATIARNLVLSSLTIRKGTRRERGGLRKEGRGRRCKGNANERRTKTDRGREGNAKKEEETSPLGTRRKATRQLAGASGPGAARGPRMRSKHQGREQECTIEIRSSERASES